ncbi:acyl carrier protein [Croceicoccus naphthovorans]|nr:acyl carrier protein [Croceicoccus naphthovorans]
MTAPPHPALPRNSNIASFAKDEGTPMDRDDTKARIDTLIEPFNKKGVAITESTTFAGDLEWDSLTVMDFVAAIEDEFDIIISMNQQAEIETYGQLIDAVTKLRA